MIGTVVSTIILVINIFFIWSKMSDLEIDWKRVRTWIYVIITTTLILLNYFNVNNFIKIFTMTLIFILIYKFLFSVRLKESVAGPVIIQIMYLIAESVFASIMFVVLKGGVQEFVSHYFGTFVTNISESLIVVCLYKIKVFRKFFISINKKMSTIDDFLILFLEITVIYIYSLLTFNIYYHARPELSIIISAFISILSFILVFFFIKARSDYYQMNNKYNSSLQSLQELENALTNHRIDSHENKNHLMTIRNMTTSKKIIKFVDSILDNKLKDNKRIMHETGIIPAGGLRGLIYSKLLLMANKNIEYELDIASSVRVVDVFEFGDNTLLDICKIVGIFLDNAIEEVDCIEDKYIVIEMYKDEDTFTISITNTYDNTIDKKDIYKAGVSTKGGNHGYGLSLVKKIVKSNKKLNTYHELNENEFTQVVNIYK